MSSVRRLLAKSNYAPPSSTSSTNKPRLNLPNHGSTEEQLLAIEQQRERTQMHQVKLKAFTTKVKTQRVESKSERHKVQWLTERTALFEERERAQSEVDGMWAQLDRSFALSQPSCSESATAERACDSKKDVPVQVAVKTVRMEYFNDRSSTMDVARAILTSVLGLRARVTQHILQQEDWNASTSSSSTAPSAGKQQTELARQQLELQESIRHVKACLEEERQDLQSLVLLGQETVHAVGVPPVAPPRDGMGKMLKQLASSTTHVNDEEDDCITNASTAGGGGSIEDVEAQAEVAVEDIRHRCPHCPDDAFGLFRGSIWAAIEQARERLLSLHNAHHLADSDALSSRAAAALSGASNNNDDDAEDTRLRVEMLMRSYDPSRNRKMFGKTREELFERIVHDLPDAFPNVKAARAAVLAIESRRSQRREQRLILSQVKENVLRLVRCLGDVAAAEEDVFSFSEAIRLEREAEEEQQAARRRDLDAQRAAHDERMAAKTAAEAAARDAAKVAEDARKAKQQAEFDGRLAELARYHQEKVEAEERQRAANEAIRIAAEQEKAREAAHNQQRVEVRRQAYEARVDDMRLQKLLADEEAQRKREAYDKFFASIDATMGVERDASRAIQGTVASGQESGSGYVGAREAVAHHTTGFMTERLLNDPRFKIHQALIAANLHHTAYARQIVSSQFRVGASLQPSADNPLAQHR